MATAGDDRKVILWSTSNPAKPAIVRTITDFTAAVMSVMYSPDGRTLAAAAGSAIALWDVTDATAPAKLGTLTGQHIGLVTSVAFSADGRTLASVGADGLLVVWDVTDRRAGRMLAVRAGHEASVLSVAFSPNDKLATAGADRRTIIWRLEDWADPKQIRDLPGQTDGLRSVTFNRTTGRRSVVVTADGTVRAWDITDPAAPTLVAAPKADNIVAVAMGPDDRYLITGGSDNLARVLRLPT